MVLFIETGFARMGEKRVVVVAELSGMMVVAIVVGIMFEVPREFCVAIWVSDGKVWFSKCCQQRRCGRDVVANVAMVSGNSDRSSLSWGWSCLWRHRKGVFTSSSGSSPVYW